MGVLSGYKRPDGTDIGLDLVERAYLINRYPEFADTFKQAGLWGWGRNDYGQIGNSARVTLSSPIQTIAGGTNWKYVDCGYTDTVAIKTDGTLWVWGSNFNGNLGDNTGVAKSSPIQTIAGGTNWKQVSSGSNIVAAIKTDSTLWVWGNNSTGQLGDNTITTRSSPVQTIAGGTNWKQVAVSARSVLAIKTNGTLWGMGQGDLLGQNSNTSKSSPVQTVAGGTNWKQVAAGYSHSMAIKTDGTLWTWGSNFYGMIGDNTTTTRLSPVQTVSGGTNWLYAKAAGKSYSMAIKMDGSLWTWGYNNNGQLGDQTLVNKSSPIQTVAGGTNWKQVAGGYSQTMAIRDDSADPI